MIPARMKNTAGKNEAQARVLRLDAFRAELAQLESEGAIALTEEQRQGLDRHIAHLVASLKATFDIDTTESQARISWGMRIASALGGIALCLSVFLFFYRFWGLLDTPVQVGILIATPLILVLATDFAARRERTLYFAMLLAIVAIASFILDLNVLGSIFNITPSPNALLAWGAFALALAYGYGLRIPLVAGLVCVLGWLSASLLVWTGSYWDLVFERPETVLCGAAILVAAGAFLPHRTRTEFPPVYRSIGLVAALVSVFVVSTNGRLSVLPFSHHPIESFYLFAGLVLSAAVVWWGISLRSHGVVNLGTIFFTLFLFARLYRWWWDLMPKYLFFLIISGIFIGLLVVFKRLRTRLEGGVTA